VLEVVEDDSARGWVVSGIVEHKGVAVQRSTQLLLAAFGFHSYFQTSSVVDQSANCSSNTKFVLLEDNANVNWYALFLF
jgi:hypothetical protein